MQLLFIAVILGSLFWLTFILLRSLSEQRSVEEKIFMAKSINPILFLRKHIQALQKRSKTDQPTTSTTPLPYLGWGVLALPDQTTTSTSPIPYRGQRSVYALEKREKSSATESSYFIDESTVQSDEITRNDGDAESLNDFHTEETTVQNDKNNLLEEDDKSANNFHTKGRIGKCDEVKTPNKSHKRKHSKLETSFATDDAVISLSTRSMEFESSPFHIRMNFTSVLPNDFLYIKPEEIPELQRTLGTIVTLIVARTDQDDALPIVEEWKGNAFYLNCPRVFTIKFPGKTGDNYSSRKRLSGKKSKTSQRAPPEKFLQMVYFLAEINEPNRAGKFAPKKERPSGDQVLLELMTKKLTEYLNRENDDSQEPKDDGIYDWQFLNSSCYQTYKNGVEKDWGELNSCLVYEKLNETGSVENMTATADIFDETDEHKHYNAAFLKQNLEKLHRKVINHCYRVLHKKFLRMKNLPDLFHAKIRQVHLVIKKINRKGYCTGTFEQQKFEKVLTVKHEAISEISGSPCVTYDKTSENEVELCSTDIKKHKNYSKGEESKLKSNCERLIPDSHYQKLPTQTKTEFAGKFQSDDSTVFLGKLLTMIFNNIDQETRAKLLYHCKKVNATLPHSLVKGMHQSDNNTDNSSEECIKIKQDASCATKNGGSGVIEWENLTFVSVGCIYEFIYLVNNPSEELKNVKKMLESIIWSSSEKNVKAATTGIPRKIVDALLSKRNIIAPENIPQANRNTTANCLLKLIIPQVIPCPHSPNATENLNQRISQRLKFLQYRNVTTPTDKDVLRKLVPPINKLKKKKQDGTSQN